MGEIEPIPSEETKPEDSKPEEKPEDGEAKEPEEKDSQKSPNFTGDLKNPNFTGDLKPFPGFRDMYGGDDPDDEDSPELIEIPILKTSLDPESTLEREVNTNLRASQVTIALLAEIREAVYEIRDVFFELLKNREKPEKS